ARPDLGHRGQLRGRPTRGGGRTGQPLGYLGVRRPARGRCRGPGPGRGRGRLRHRPAAVDRAREMVGADQGRRRRYRAVLARGCPGGGSVTAVAGIAGTPLELSEVDDREYAVRTGPASSALPDADSSEGRQLRRWLVQLMAAERLVALEAVDPSGAPGLA